MESDTPLNEISEDSAFEVEIDEQETSDFFSGLPSSNTTTRGWNFKDAIQKISKFDTRKGRSEKTHARIDSLRSEVVVTPIDQSAMTKDVIKPFSDSMRPSQKSLSQRPMELHQVTVDDDAHDEVVENDADIDEIEEATFYDQIASAGPETDMSNFDSLNISRPLMHAIEKMGFVSPTPVQMSVIPLALAGRDVCVSAETGSGKTAAFLLPILERLYHLCNENQGNSKLSRRRNCQPVVRILILTPTRELACQCYSMLQSLCKFMPSVSSCLITGGSKNIRSQEAELRLKPDILICTPGRLTDHLTNSPSFNLDDIEVLVLDEADKLLELGFKTEIEAILGHCPPSSTRQTMLFTATMTTSVKTLMTLALNKPIRVRVDTSSSSMIAIPSTLSQEFIRVKWPTINSLKQAARFEKGQTRGKGEDEEVKIEVSEVAEEEQGQAFEEKVIREAILLSLLVRVCRSRVLVFFDRKSQAHEFLIKIKLLGIMDSVSELHGDLSQTERLETLDKFRSGELNVLLATDVASRGLDVPNVSSVICFNMPATSETYTHRIGRTARAGKVGRSITMFGENRRAIIRQTLKQQAIADGSERNPVKSRVIPCNTILYFAKMLMAEDLRKNLKSVLRREQDDENLKMAEMEAERAENIIIHEPEIMARPKRVWIQSEKQKRRDQMDAYREQKLPEPIVEDKEKEDEKKKKKEEDDSYKYKRVVNFQEDEEDEEEGQRKRNRKKENFDDPYDGNDDEYEFEGRKKKTRRSNMTELHVDDDDDDRKTRKQPRKNKFEEEWKGADRNQFELRKGGKPGRHAFKSSKRFKRR